MFKFLVMYSNVQKFIAEKDDQTSQQRSPNSEQVNPKLNTELLQLQIYCRSLFTCLNS